MTSQDREFTRTQIGYINGVRASSIHGSRLVAVKATNVALHDQTVAERRGVVASHLDFSELGTSTKQSFVEGRTSYEETVFFRNRLIVQSTSHLQNDVDKIIATLTRQRSTNSTQTSDGLSSSVRLRRQASTVEHSSQNVSVVLALQRVCTRRSGKSLKVNVRLTLFDVVNLKRKSVCLVYNHSNLVVGQVLRVYHRAT